MGWRMWRGGVVGGLLLMSACGGTVSVQPAGAAVPSGDRTAIVSVVETLSQNAGLPAPRRVVVTDPATVARLAVASDSLQPALPGATSCPADVGTSYVVAFALKPQASPNITFTLGSCDRVEATSPGGLSTSLADDPAFDDAYRRVLGLTG